MSLWTKKEVEQILIQLNAEGLPFENHPFIIREGEAVCLGRGAYARVYEAGGKEKDRRAYAIKVMGFDDRYMEEEDFLKTVEAQKTLSGYQDHVVKVYDHAVLKVNGLELQFILMEKLEPVFTGLPGHKYRLDPPALACFEEQEILKVAYDIGTALASAHDRLILHRDIKPENIFYSEKTGQYKLGDFGIALKTKEGMASTVAYTDGYGAPEVIKRSEDKYDQTADIYSLGMMLFVLLNRMRFPGSDSYQVNSQAQYASGFVLPKPETGSDRLADIVKKMCRFDPDDRYQSMDEVLLDLDALRNNALLRYQKSHINLMKALGAVFLIGGVAAWKQELTWVAFTSLSLALVFAIQLLALWGSKRTGRQGEKIITMYVKNNKPWIVAAVCYASLIAGGWIYTHWMTEELNSAMARLFGAGYLPLYLSIQPMKAGTAGLAFSVFWMLRDRILSVLDDEKRRGIK